MSFRYVRGPTSDVTFEAEAATIDGLFKESARALLGVMYDMDSVQEQRREALELEAENMEELLHLFLSELLVVVEVEDLFPKRIDLEFKGTKLKANLWGENTSSRKLQTLVKGVTYHDFSLSKTQDGWKSRVVLDI